MVSHVPAGRTAALLDGKRSYRLARRGRGAVLPKPLLAELPLFAHRSGLLVALTMARAQSCWHWE